MKRLLLIFGDQLDPNSALFDDADPATDLFWMAEVLEESRRVRSHKIRSAFFLSAMRHFRNELRDRGFQVHYHSLRDERPASDFRSALLTDLNQIQPTEIRCVLPGEHHICTLLKELGGLTSIPLHFAPDRHFICAPAEFREHAKGRKSLRMEYFYREMRLKTRLLLDQSAQPEGGKWNYDAANRSAFPKTGPGEIPPHLSFAPDRVSREVLEDVDRHFPGHPGDLDTFDWPVTPWQARQALDDFIANRLPAYGKFQDAMWTGEPWLHHARLSAAMNVKLIDPLTVCQAAEAAWRTQPDRYPLEAVEGFVRQVIGWREYVRGIYWLHMPDYLQRNALEATLPLPSFYWDGKTDMNCLRESIAQTLRYGYAHHIQRLMVTGLFPLLLGVDPVQVHEWYLAVYLDAVEWVELPNTLGMSQYADGGLMASKPYVATGKYIQRMSNYCVGCRYKPDKKTGPDACPFTTLYWDFLLRHRERLAENPRMSLQVRNLERLSAPELDEIRAQADTLKQTLPGKHYL